MRLGLIFILVASGLTLIFGFLGILNFAHGAFYMLGAYFMITAVDLVNSFWYGLILVILIGVLFGVLLERLLIRYTYDMDEMVQLIVTIGLALFVEGMVTYVWGSEPLGTSVPSALIGQVQLLSVDYPTYNLFIIISSISIIAVGWLGMRYTRVGLVIRASMSDEKMAIAQGNNISHLYALIFTVGTVFAVLAGAIIVPMRGVTPDMGHSMLLEAFIIVILGGLGSIRGTVLMGLVVGFTSTFLTEFVSDMLSSFVIFIILILVLMIRPHGIFGTGEHV